MCREPGLLSSVEGKGMRVLTKPGAAAWDGCAEIEAARRRAARIADCVKRKMEGCG
jgi:hypothetical protein